ncbi:MAG: hypothetical protein PHR91_04905 [Candidatus Omnitrophica bacterium]|nr:hypothetical protein [Candidatus Omnitrophota bacterium]
MVPDGQDAEGIGKEIEKRRERALELDVPNLIASLYHDHIKFYPEWMRNQRSRVWIYPSITEASQVDEHRIKLVMGGINYIFSFTEKWIGGERLGLLELYRNDIRVLAINMAWEVDKREKEHNIFDIEEFIEGDWVYYFKDLNAFINKKLKF